MKPPAEVPCASRRLQVAIRAIITGLLVGLFGASLLVQGIAALDR